MQSAVGQQAPGAFDLSGVLGERGHACYSVCIICCICETISFNIYFDQSHKSAQLDGQTRLDHPRRLPRRERSHGARPGSSQRTRCNSRCSQSGCEPSCFIWHLMYVWIQQLYYWKDFISCVSHLGMLREHQPERDHHESIDDYGDTIKEALRVQQAIEAEEELESGEEDEVSTKSSLPSPRAGTGWTTLRRMVTKQCLWASAEGTTS